jgi:flavin reductase (DIM6/NTAB) family NADH-FMN oxidoreductase RutF
VDGRRDLTPNPIEDLHVTRSVTQQEFRETLALWPSGVTVVTAREGEIPLGMTVSSFSSLSLDPPLVLACIAKSAKSHDGIVAAPGFAIHVLSRDQEDISRLFARPGPEKFDGIAASEGPYRAPVLPLGVARLMCAHHAGIDGGDHTILIGRVLEVERTDQPPLIYWDRDYRSAT